MYKLTPVDTPKYRLVPVEQGPERTIGGTIGDIGISAAKGIVGTVEALVGAADIVTGGGAGNLLEKIGYDPKTTHQFLESYYSPAQKEANRKVQEAEGFWDTTKAMVQNPSTIGHSVVESLPPMLGGAAAARGLVTRGVPALVAAATGEGLVGAGMSAEQIRQDTGDLTLGQTAQAIGSGVGTSVIALAGGRIAQKLGIGDIDVMLAGGGRGATQKGIIKRIIGGGISEGAFEELPQSIQEQVWMNAALDKPLMEGVPEAGATGMLTGAGMGAGANIFTTTRGNETQPEQENREPERPVESKYKLTPVEEPSQEQPQPEQEWPEVKGDDREVSPMQEQSKRHFDNEFQKNQEIKQQIDGDVMARDKEYQQAEAAGIERENLMPDEVDERQKIQSLRRAFTQNKRRLETLRKAGVNPEQQKELERQIEEAAHRLEAYDKEERGRQVVRNNMKLKRDNEADIALKNRPYREDTGGSRSVDFNRQASIDPEAQVKIERQIARKMRQFERAKGPRRSDIAVELEVLNRKLDSVRNDERGARRFDAFSVSQNAKSEPQADLSRTDERQVTPAVSTQGAEKKKQVHDHSNTQVEIGGETAQKMVAFGNSIPDSEIYEDPNDDSYGREGETHVTVKYGLKNSDPSEVENIVSGFGPIKAKMGKVSIFDGDKYDVIKVDIDSPDLKRLNKLIEKNAEIDLPKGNTFPYSAHATLAYVKPGEGKKYVGAKDFEGTELEFDSIVLSAKDGKKHTISLVSKAPDLSPKDALPAAESMQRGAQEKPKEYSPKSSNKKDMVAVVRKAKKSAPQSKPYGTDVKFGKPATYNGIKQISVKYNPVGDGGFGLKLELPKDKDGWRITRVDHDATDKYGHNKETVVSKTRMSLKDAKEFAKAYIEGKTEPDGKVTFKTSDGNAEFKIFNSQYHLEQFENRVKKTPGVQYSTLTPQQAAKEHNLTYDGEQERPGKSPYLQFTDKQTGDTYTVSDISELPDRVSKAREGKLGKANENFQAVTKEDVKEFFKNVKNSSVRKRRTDGAIIVQIGNRTPLRIKNVGYIGIDEAAFQVEYGRKPGRGEQAAGSYKDGEIKVSSIGDKWTLAHESFHWLEDIGVINHSDIRAIDKAIGKKSTAEDRAKWFEANRQARDTKGRLGKAIQKIRDFIDSIVNLFHRTARGVIRDVESGKVFDRKGQAQKTVVPQYEKTAQRWYSQMQNFFEKKLPGKASPAQLKQMLTSWANKGEYKAEELDWSGVLDWLDSQDGKVSKQDVLDYLAENNLRVEEVVKEDVSDELNRKFNEAQNAVDRARSEGRSFGEIDYLSRIRDDLRNDIQQAREFDTETTKFSQYQLPGGEAYKELLITMPVKPEMNGKIVEEAGLFQVYDDSGEWIGRAKTREAAEGFLTAKTGDKASYRSSHWDEPNVLVHSRFHEQTVDGQRLIIIDELQGDWQSDIRKKGSTADSAKVISDLSKKYPNLPKDSGKWSLSVLEEIGATQSERDRWYDARMRGKVPDAPWKKTYYLKAMQRMVRYAAENGFDGIAWTPGSVHFERWGSERIAWKKISQQKIKVLSNQEAAHAIENGERVHWHRFSDGNTVEMHSVESVTDRRSEYLKAVKGGDAEWRTGGVDVDGSIAPMGSGWIVNVKEQTGGNAGGVDIETEADARNMNAQDGKFIKTKSELRELIDSIAQRERHQYSHENYEAMLDARTDKTWKRMQEEDAGVSLPRKEGFENIYDEKIPNEVKKFFGKKAWGSPKVGTIDVVTEKRIGEKITPELLAKAAAAANRAGDSIPAKWLGEQVKQLEDTGEYSYAIHNPNPWQEAKNPPSFYVDQVRTESDKSETLWHLPITPQMKSKALREGMPLYSTKIDEDKRKTPDFIKEKFGKHEGTLKETITETFDKIKTKEFWDTATTKTIDRLHPIKAKAGEKAYRLHRIETGTQAVFAMLMEHGKLKWDASGFLRVDERKDGFIPFLRKQGKDWNKFIYWVAAKRAEALEGEGRERWLDKETRDKIFEWAGGKNNPKWQKAAKELKAFNANILDIAEQAGLIDPSSRGVWEQEFYVPFYRIFENEQDRAEFLKAPRKSKKYISAQIKKLKGAEQKLGDPLENLMHNWMHLISESMRNVARKEAFEFSVKSQSGLVEPINAKDVYSFHSSKDKKVVFATKKTGDNVLMFQNNGRPVYFKVNDYELFQAMSNVNAQYFDNFIVRLMGKAKRALTYGATFGPGFRVANLLRDTMHTSLINKSFKPFMDSAKGLVKSWREDEDYIAFMASGAGFGSSYVRADDPEVAAKYIKRIIKKEGASAKERILNTPKKMLDFWEKVGSASENAARVQLYRNLVEKGKSHTEAAFEARDLLDFTMRGEASAVQFLIQITPFLNARMQGLYKLGRAVADKENRKNFVVRGSMLMAASIALWFLHKDDDEYKELEDWDRWSYYHFWIGDLHFRIPKPFEVGAIFSSLPETLLDTMYGNEDSKHIANFIGYTAKETFAIGFPQLFNPVIEQWANKSSYTGRPIVGQHLQGLKAGEQSEPWTSETLQLAGNLGISPKRAEAILQGYFSTFGMFLLGGADIVTRNLFDFPERPSMRLDDYPLFGRFVKNKQARYTKQQTWFYETFNEIDKLNRTVRHYQSTGQYEKIKDLSKNDIKKLRMKKWFNKTRRYLSLINSKIKSTMRSNLSDDEKREKIDDLIKKRNEIVKKMYEAVNGDR